MKYTLLQIDSGTSLELEEEYWLTVLEKARAEGWSPEGTHFDFDFEMDEAIEEHVDDMDLLFSYLMLNNEYADWQGSYTERENQVISEPDAYYLYQAIADVIDDPPLHQLLQKGNIRICKR